MNSITQVVLFLLGLTGLVLTSKSFAGDKVIEVIPKNEEQIKFLQNLQLEEGVDFWQRPHQIGSPVDIHITREQIPFVNIAFAPLGINYRTKIEDLQRLISTEKSPRARSRFSPSEVLLRYASVNEISAFLDDAASRCGSRCQIMPFGKSYEGRDMRVIKVSGSSGSSKPAVFVDGGIHAREWISPAFVNNLINKLIEDYNSDQEVKAMLDAYDWYILPILNPDGYQYSHDADRMWRKNRAPTKRSRCVGVDLNRNFGFQWGVAGVSSNPCSEIYPGEEAFSEPESQALRDFLDSINNLEVYLTFHSYGQYFLFPWGYGRVEAPNHDDMQAAGDAAVRGLNGDKNWIVGNSAIALYPSAGASDDWAYHLGASYSYCIELPPNEADGSGFILPERRIPEVVSSVWPGVKSLMRNIMENRGHASKFANEVADLESLFLQKEQTKLWEPEYI